MKISKVRAEVMAEQLRVRAWVPDKQGQVPALNLATYNCLELQLQRCQCPPSLGLILTYIQMAHKPHTQIQVTKKVIW